MENNLKKEGYLINLILGILFCVLGLGLILTAFILNYDKSKEWYIYFMYFFGSMLFLGACGELYFYFQNKLNLKKMNVKQMCVIAILAALSVVLYYFGKFNLPFFPSWLDIQFSDFPALLVSFMYGPLSGILTIVIRFFCKLPGTTTVGVGELADLFIGIALCSVAGLIYKKHRSFKGALCAMSIGMLTATLVACLANWWILIPAYVNIAHFPLPALVKELNKYLSSVTTDNFMIWYIFVGVLPFNLFRYTLVFIITLIVYKRLHILIEHITK